MTESWPANKRLVNESKHSLIQLKVLKLTFFDSSLILRLFLFSKLVDIKSSERLKCYKVNTENVFFGRSSIEQAE